MNTDSQAFEKLVTLYRRQLGIVLAENPWAFWKRGFWTYGSWSRHDSELQKILVRIYGLLDDLLRIDQVSDSHQERIRQWLTPDATTLTLAAAIEVFDGLDRIMIEIGDAQYVCAEIEGELQWARGSTTWLTWDAMYGHSIPHAVKTYRSGKVVPGGELDAARNQLLSFRRTRSDDYQVHRARQKMRAKNLRVLAVLLFPLVVAFGWLLAAGEVGDIEAWGVGLVGVAGALGSLMSGTMRARDRLIRGSDLRAFRAGLSAQVLLGAASSLVVLLLLASGILDVAGTDSLEGKAVIGFLAGFSEPFFLNTVGRVAKLGEESGKPDGKSTNERESDDEEAET